ncbi:hypothetical protein CH373_02875 [Leptospira perolatii]|uniref:Uncharacterized protein n=1 Tax=Leptospira perolatii TaxID=2023191 RepID=A0A2M9ZSF0_9LEPT|nr:hypothetical protein [Leptospira perolatii]PJZ71457.1 hypothetical protein CH360_02870 [Leptospira perolatii]PJZ74992.1 hypothetical protein CH373_02875 [Leptospira perolatii]
MMKFKRAWPFLIAIYCFTALLHSESAQRSLLEYTDIFVSSDKFGGICSEKNINQITGLTIDGWSTNTSTLDINEKIANFYKLAECATSLRILVLRSNNTDSACSVFLQELDVFNNIYGEKLQKIFSGTATYYEKYSFTPDCSPKNKTPNYIGPENTNNGFAKYNYELKNLKKDQCLKKIQDLSTFHMQLVSLKSEPSEWSEELKKKYRTNIEKDLERLKGLNHCSRLRTVIINLPAILYVPRSAYRDREIYGKMNSEERMFYYDKIYKVNLDAFRKIYGKRIQELLPNKEILLHNTVW